MFECGGAAPSALEVDLRDRLHRTSARGVTPIAEWADLHWTAHDDAAVREFLRYTHVPAAEPPPVLESPLEYPAEVLASPAPEPPVELCEPADTGRTTARPRTADQLLAPTAASLSLEVQILQRELARERALHTGATTDLSAARAEIARLRSVAGLPPTDRGPGLEAVMPQGSVDPGTVGTVADVMSRLNGVAPGPQSAHLLSALTGDLGLTTGRLGRLDALTEEQVLSTVSAAHRLAAWAGALECRAAGELRERYAGSFGGEDEGLWPTATEIALATGTTRHAVAALLHAARWLPVAMPRLFRLWAQGRLDSAKAVMVTDKAQGLSGIHHPDVEAALVAPAGTDEAARTVAETATRGQLSSLLDRLVIAADPASAEEAAAEQRRERRLRFRALAHGMAQMTLIAGADQVEAMRADLNALTAAARTGAAPVVRPDDPDNPRLGPDPDDPEQRLPSATRVDVLADVLAAAAARVSGTDCSTTPDSCATAGSSVPESEQPTADTGQEAATDTLTPDAALPDWLLRPTGRSACRSRSRVLVTVPLSVLTGQSDAPCTLDGYGPIPAQFARELAADGVWRCAIVDDRDGSPAHGTIVALGRSTFTPSYRPGPQLRRFVQARDGTCAAPGCRRRARQCELDHIRPWDRDGAQAGPTCDCNLHALCEHHHRLKTRGALTPARDPVTGRTVWRTPAGRSYSGWREPR